MKIKETQVSLEVSSLTQVLSAFLNFVKTVISFTYIKNNELKEIVVYKEVQWNLSVQKIWPFANMFHG